MDKLNPLEMQFLLDWFVYVMPMKQRYKLMTEHPMLYNKLVQQEVMITGRKCDQKENEVTQ